MPIFSLYVSKYPHLSAMDRLVSSCAVTTHASSLRSIG